MTLERAISKAQKIARRINEFVTVVYVDDEEGYQPATEGQLDTHYFTSKVAETVGPDGGLV